MNKKLKLLFVLFFIIFNSSYANISISYQCDTKGNLKQSTNSKEPSIYYEYDDFGRVISKNYPNGRKIQYKYDSIGNCNQVIDKAKRIFL